MTAAVSRIACTPELQRLRGTRARRVRPLRAVRQSALSESDGPRLDASRSKQTRHFRLQFSQDTS